MSQATDGKETAMGHDPLAWIAQEDAELSEPESVQEAAEALQQEVKEIAAEEAEEMSDAPSSVQDEQESIQQAVALAESAATGHIIHLQGDVGIANAHALHEELNEALQQTSKITIQAKGLTHVDTAVVQLLYAFVRDAKKLDVDVQWNAVPESFLTTLSVLGLSEKMDLA